ncbi:VOC family protein [Nocardioides sp. SYSU D00038]|uniref:VOC family protein n=1 Tax=Nocardioides sp. SYSU D00038 TaxID=2812554 RepID=UPI001967314A|nr:VOC family protein [Nocardioides sp. SYSU D00038]
MRLTRSVVVFDAAELHAESTFWAGMLDGHVFEDDTFHSVIDATGEWRIGVQLAPDHVPPRWPDGTPQQVHIDLHAEDPGQAHEQAIRLGATVLRTGDINAAEGHHVYADPAGHPFCIGWGHPSREALADFVRNHLLPDDVRPDTVDPGGDLGR